MTLQWGFPSFTFLLYVPLIVISLSLPLPFATSSEVDGDLLKRATPSSTCLEIFNATDIYTSTRYYNNLYTFPAKLAYDCLISVPLNYTVASQFVHYFKDTLQFQSTLAYLRNPPPSYQQPPIDVLGSLNLIQQQLDSGVYDNSYAFEAAIQSLVYATHDGHVSLAAGALNVFTFLSPLRLTSVSPDGLKLPQVYCADDLLQDQNGWSASALTHINGEDAVDFLDQFAAGNAQGTLEPHADYQQLFYSAAASIQNQVSAFEGTTPFYPGENVTFTFENGTVVGPTPWLATSDLIGYTPPIFDGQDFYNFFVVNSAPGLYRRSRKREAQDDSSGGVATTTINPLAAASGTFAASLASGTFASYAAVTTTDPLAATSTTAGWNNQAYPHPVYVQPNLGGGNGEILTGYFLNDSSTAVLSIPSFNVQDDAIQSFSDTVGSFLQLAKGANMQRLVVDLQKNGGGLNLLAEDTFRHFFPSIDPFGGSRFRAHEFADVIGNTYTRYFDANGQTLNSSYYQVLATSPWVATDSLFATTGQNFTSWSELYGPVLDHGDSFSVTQRDNDSSIIFDEGAGGLVIYGFANRSATAPQPFEAENIILLTDSSCSSSCAIFMELMHHQAGVRTVVAGGLPQIGPMQALGGVRGALSYPNYYLDQDMSTTVDMNESAAALLPNRDVEFLIYDASINLRDQIRQGEDFPLQFAYEAADCRIFYTPQTFNNYTNLWSYAANAIWVDPTLCVQNSTDQPSSNTTDKIGPSLSQKQAWAASIPNQGLGNETDGDSPFVATPYSLAPNVSELLFDELHQKTIGLDKACKAGKLPRCQSPFQCVTELVCSTDKLTGLSKWEPQETCRQTCNFAGDDKACGDKGKCMEQRNCVNREEREKIGKIFKTSKKWHCTGTRFYCRKTSQEFPDANCATQTYPPPAVISLPVGKAYIIDPTGNTKPPEGKEEEKMSQVTPTTPESDAAVGSKTRKDYIQHEDVGHMVMAGMAEWDD